MSLVKRWLDELWQQAQAGDEAARQTLLDAGQVDEETAAAWDGREYLPDYAGERGEIY